MEEYYECVQQRNQRPTGECYLPFEVSDTPARHRAARTCPQRSASAVRRLDSSRLADFAIRRDNRGRVGPGDIAAHRPWLDDVPRQADAFPQPDRDVGDVQ